MEWDDEEQIDLAEDIVYDANGGNDSARYRACGLLQHRQPEIQVLVVTARDQLCLR